MRKRRGRKKSKHTEKKRKLKISHVVTKRKVEGEASGKRDGKMLDEKIASAYENVECVIVILLDI